MRKLKITELHRLTSEEYKKSQKLPLVIILDDVRSMYNVGSIFRTSDAFRVERILLCGITSVPPHPEIHKTALGAECSVDWSYMSSAVEAVEKCRAEGYTVLGVEQVEGSISLNTFMPHQDGQYAVVLGNEVKGVRQEVIDACDGCLEIPQFGTKHSLNVSVTAGIVIWRFAEKMMIE